MRCLLERSRAWRALPPAGRRQVAHDTVLIGEQLADPGWHGGVAQALEQAPGEPLRQGAAAAAVSTFRDVVGAVDFPGFVASLIQGVFQAIVDASIQQMQAYQTLVASVVRSAAQIGQETVNQEQACQYLAATWPDRLRVDGAGEAARVGLLPGQNLGDELSTRLGLEEGRTLDDPAGQAAAIGRARLELGRQRQQTLATLVMMGINRIIVTNGRINAKVLFDIRAEDSASRAATSSTDKTSDAQRTTTAGIGGLLGAWGAGIGTTSRSGVTTRVRSAVDETSDARMKLKAQLSGDVDLYFKSETFPLERLAPARSVESVRRHALPDGAEST